MVFSFCFLRPTPLFGFYLQKSEQAIPSMEVAGAAYLHLRARKVEYE